MFSIPCGLLDTGAFYTIKQQQQKAKKLMFGNEKEKKFKNSERLVNPCPKGNS